MDGVPPLVLELLFSGSVLVWAAWELWSVRKKKSDDPGHPERKE